MNLRTTSATVAVAAACSLALLAAGCGSDRPEVSGGGTDQYYGLVTVLESPDHGPQLCGAVAESYPPQCSGPAIEGWDWSIVDAESAGGTTWGEYTINVTYDEESNTFDLVGRPGVASPQEREALAPDGPDFSTPCDPDAITGDPAAGDELDESGLASIDGFGGLWFDQRSGTFNVVYVGDPDPIEATVREHYDGLLCLVEGSSTLDELGEIQASIEVGGPVYATWIDVTDNVVVVGTYAFPRSLAAQLTETHGADSLRFEPLLRGLV